MKNVFWLLSIIALMSCSYNVDSTETAFDSDDLEFVESGNNIGAQAPNHNPCSMDYDVAEIQNLSGETILVKIPIPCDDEYYMETGDPPPEGYRSSSDIFEKQVLDYGKTDR